ncbi:integrase [Arthrobacter sp. SW1]|nr:integrase [Arthrobacter sp. SW1]
MYPVKALLGFVGLPSSTYYYHRAKARKEDKYAASRALIKEIFDEARGRYGHRRIRIELARRHDVRMSGKTVLREMSRSGCICRIRRRKYRSYKGEAGKTAPNVLKRNFRAKAPNTKWGTDVTEFKVAGRRIYLSPVIDMFNGEIVSYKVSSSPSMAMVTGMLTDAIVRLGPGDRPVLHSDQGWQYQNLAYRRLLARHGIKQSMSRKGNCLDNALVESFFGHLKEEFYRARRFSSPAEFTKELDAYIHWYNHVRIKQSLRGLSPVQFRTEMGARSG